MNVLNNTGLVQAKPLSRILGEMSVVAAVHVSSLGMTRLDRSASAQSDRAHNAMMGAGRTNVKRLPGSESEVNGIKAKHTQARTLVLDRTTAWGKDRRLLPNIYIGEVSGEFQDIKNEHDRLRDSFVRRAYDHIQRAHANLGSYDVPVPTVHEIERAFSLELELTPVPDISAYTAGDSALEQDMKRRFEADIKQSYENAQKDLLKRLVEPLDKMVERMAAYAEREERKANDEDTGKTGTFKSTVITNITDLGKLFKALNVTGDPVLITLVDRLDAFERIGHDDLVKDAALRAETARQAADIRKSLEAWL